MTSNKWDPSHGLDYITASSNMAISLLSREAGFESIQPLALDTLSNLLGQYLERLLASTHAYAELGNRAKPNYHDITQSMHDAGIQLRDLAAYMVNTLSDLENGVSMFASEPELSTEPDVPQFLPSEDEDEEGEGNTEASNRPAYVPHYLPNFPSKHSFRETPVYIQRPDNPQRVRELNSQQTRLVEENLKQLMSAENRLGRLYQNNADGSDDGIMAPIANYEASTQRRKRIKRASISLKTSSPLLPNVVEQSHPSPPHSSDDDPDKDVPVENA